MFRALVASLTFLALGSVVWAQDSADAKVLKEEVAKFQDAYNSHDSEALTASWGDDVDLISADGTIYEGREAVTALYKSQFDESPQISIASEVFRVRVVGDAAVVDGAVNISPTPDEAPQSTRFTAVFARKGNEAPWQVVSLREAALPPASASDKLEPLAWFVGDWVDDSDEGRKVFTTFEWSPEGDELCRTSVASGEDGGRRLIESHIFWNPKTERIESCTHDDDRLVCGVWSKEGDDWVVSTTELDEEGNQATARYKMSPKGDNEMTVQTLERTAGENKIESSPAVTVKRLQ